MNTAQLIFGSLRLRFEIDKEYMQLYNDKKMDIFLDNYKAIEESQVFAADTIFDNKLERWTHLNENDSNSYAFKVFRKSLGFIGSGLHKPKDILVEL